MPRRARKRAHGQGTVYQRGPRNWGVSWREGTRRRYSGGYETREIAEQIRAKIVADLAAGRAGLPEAPMEVPALATLADAWLERRNHTHRAIKQDRSRWKKHLGPYFGRLLPAEVDHAGIRRFVETGLVAGMSSSSLGHCVRLLSSLFSDLVERGMVAGNPILTLPKSTRRLYRSAHDPRTTPFIEKLKDLRRVFLQLGEPFNMAFAVGALAGLRPGEVLGLDAADIDIAGRRIHVKRQVKDGKIGPLKDDESRIVPITDALKPALAAWLLRSGNDAQLFRPARPGRGGRPGSPSRFIGQDTLNDHLADALTKCALPPLTWYQATRHTFASQWVLGGRSMEKLAEVMGHSSTVVTERYAHLRPDLFRDEDYAVFDIDLRPGRVAKPGTKSGTFGYSMATESR